MHTQTLLGAQTLARFLTLEQLLSDAQRVYAKACFAIFGNDVPEQRQDREEDTAGMVCDMLDAKHGIQVKRSDLYAAHRNGRQRRATITVRFASILDGSPHHQLVRRDGNWKGSGARTKMRSPSGFTSSKCHPTWTATSTLP